MKKGFTLAEALIALTVTGVLVTMGVSSIKKKDFAMTNKVAVVKADATISLVVNHLVNESSFYATSKDMAVTNIDDHGKFREEFLKAMTSTYRRAKESDQIDLRGAVWKSGNKYAFIACNQSMDGLIWCIDDTDFRETNTVKVDESNYAPVVVYVKGTLQQAEEERTEEKEAADAEEFFKKNAIVYGVRRDGKIIFLDDLIDAKDYPNAMHYDAQNLLKSAK